MRIQFYLKQRQMYVILLIINYLYIRESHKVCNIQGHTCKCIRKSTRVKTNTGLFTDESQKESSESLPLGINH